MKKLDLKNLSEKEAQLVEILKCETGLKVNKVRNEGIINSIYVNSQGDNFFINAIIFKPAPIVDNPLPGAMTVQDIFMPVYFDKQRNRVALATVISDATFIPIKGSDMLGIIKTPTGYMMTYSTGRSINNNTPIKFNDELGAGKKLATLTFTWKQEDFKLDLDPKELSPRTIFKKTVEENYSVPENFFYLVVDKTGNPVGSIYDSTTGSYLPLQKTNLSLFERDFINRSANQAKEEEIRRIRKIAKLYELIPKEGE